MRPVLDRHFNRQGRADQLAFLYRLAQLIESDLGFLAGEHDLLNGVVRRETDLACGKL